VDANVHPQKSQVRFAHERTVYSALSSAVSHALHEYPRTEMGQSTVWPFWGQPSSMGSSVSETSEGYVPHALRALAQLHGTYILAQTYDGLAIADQHAAHEQVLFERLSQADEIHALTPPVQLVLPLREAQVLEKVAILLFDLGVEVEPFGNSAYLIRALPAVLSNQDPVELVTSLIQEAAAHQGRDDLLRDRLVSRAACLGAVKAGDPLSEEQMQWLLDELGETWSPANCPHGRPALVSISLQELARRFGRHTH
jgi:DNA mismatch repair protein MutL